ncbi:MAG TPA: A/G-specific adenine glycosylase [Saprospiraceae bacterium]|nr:A/G-specific adenine glycosylase [Saprospiraceae bacterium]
MAKSPFSKKLLRWQATYDRKMPWKDRTDAYAIWLSEIILQQTRVEQGLPYYLRFLDTFPTVQDLAQADEKTVMKLWEGLGYYSRARHLHFTARYIAEELGGLFPDNYKDLLKLKGVGPYTAAAIASFAYGLPHAVVDGNVFRVLARYTADFTDISSTVGRQTFTQLANQLLDPAQAGAFNQALMDLGALVCKPTNPTCSICPVQEGCRALAQNIIGDLPVKSKKIKRQTRYFYFFIFRKGRQTWIQKRDQKDIWQSLYEFPKLESNRAITQKELKAYLSTVAPQYLLQKPMQGPFTQLLTHQKIIGHFFEVKVTKAPRIDRLLPIHEDRLAEYPFPKMIKKYLDTASAIG